VQDLLELYAQTTSRNASFLLNLSPDSRGLLPDEQVDGLRELGRMINRHAITSTQRGATDQMKQQNGWRKGQNGSANLQ